MPVRYAFARPCAALLPFVARYWQVASARSDARSRGRWSIPDGGTEWLFVLGGPLRRDGAVYRAGAYVSGISTAASHSAAGGAFLTFGIAFRPAGAAAFVRMPASELAGRIESLEDVWGAGSGTLAARLAGAQSFAARVEIAQSELLRRAAAPDREVDAAIARLLDDPSVRVGELSRGRASARTLERRFLSRVGVSAKRLARILRLRRSAQLWASGEAREWASLSAAAGYADQAHFVREFQALTGVSPGSVFRDPERLSDLFNTPEDGPAILARPEEDS